MWINGRWRTDRVVHHRARQEFAALTSERDELKAENAALKRQLAWTVRDRDEATALLRELRAAVQERCAAEQRLASLYRDRTIRRARMATRDADTRLQ